MCVHVCIYICIFLYVGFPGKESACKCRRHEFDPWVGKIPWRKKWQPTPVFLPGESHGQRSLAGYGLITRRSQRVRHNRVTKHSRPHTT